VKHWKIGEVARLSGISLRALRHYDEIGLLSPGQRSDAGYRLYTRAELERLSHIKVLRSIGWSLEQIRECLTNADFSPQKLIQIHRANLAQRIAAEQKLLARLESLAARMQEQEISPEEFLQWMEEITMIEKYYSAEQLAELEERKNTVGQARIKEVEAQWPILMDEVRAAIERGDDPKSPASRELARRWQSLVEEFTGGNPGIRESLNNVYENESHVGGMDVEAMRPLFDFISQASS